jgi:hypothetical protein
MTKVSTPPHFSAEPKLLNPLSKYLSTQEKKSERNKDNYIFGVITGRKNDFQTRIEWEL